MPGFLRQSTASQVIELGPFLDDTDFKTAKNALTIANTDIKLRKHGGTTHGNKNSGGATNIANGYYHTTLDATDTNTVGLLDIHVNVASALPVFDRYWVIEEAIFDALYGASAAGFDVNGAVKVAGLIKKNTAFSAFTFLMTDSTTHAPKTGVTVSATRSIDGAAFGACANAVVEMTSGWYKIDLAASDVNGRVISLRFTGGASDDRDIQLITVD